MKLNPEKSFKPNKSLLNTLKHRNLNESTNSSYLHYYGEFLKYANKAPKQIIVEDIIKYLEYLRKNKCAYSTFNINLNAIKVFHKKLFEHESLQGIKRPKIKNLNLDLLSHKEVVSLIEQLDNYKHKAIFSLVYYAGLKSGEVIRLALSDLDLKKKKLSVSFEGKVILLEPHIEALLKEYVKTIPENTQWLFPGKPAGKQYSIRSLQRLFTESAHKLGITKVITPITIRRSRAVELHKMGYDWQFIKEFLGHEGKDTTKRLYRELEKLSQKSE